MKRGLQEGQGRMDSGRTRGSEGSLLANAWGPNGFLRDNEHRIGINDLEGTNWCVVVAGHGDREVFT